MVGVWLSSAVAGTVSGGAGSAGATDAPKLNWWTEIGVPKTAVRGALDGLPADR